MKYDSASNRVSGIIVHLNRVKAYRTKLESMSLKRFASKPYVSQYGYVGSCRKEKRTYMKKVIFGILVVSLVVICLCMPYWVDDFACEQYKIEVEKVITEVDDIGMIDTLNGCGNVANGNHTYLIVTALIESEYEKEIVKDKFPDAYEVLHFEELHFETKTSRQFSKYVIDNSKKYYVLVYAKSAPFYYLDLRGH